MEFLRQWLMGVVGCAFVVSIAQELVPNGALRQLVRLTGALVLLLALLRPLGYAEPSLPAFSDLSAERTALEEQYAHERDAALAAVIAERTGAYIEDKARALSVAVRAEVEVAAENGVPMPVRVVLYGEEDAALSELIARELAISPEWRTDE